LSYTFVPEEARLNKETLNRLARLGAAARLAELRAEMATILRDFPGLTSAPRGTRHAGAGARKTATRRRRRRLSAEAREKIAAAQRARWAKVRAAKKSRG
jgi:hypothetical protein